MPSFQKDLSDLQVIDYLCGQTDRHAGNYYVKMDGNNMVGLTGIDNDLSFGDAVSRQKTKNKFNIFGNHGRLVADANDEMYIPHMSRSLALNIALLDENMAKYVLSDLIGKADVEAFCKRLKILKKVCITELQKESENSRLVDDDGWNEKTLNDFLTADSEFVNRDKDGTSNYIGNLVNSLSVDKYTRANKKFMEMKKAKK